MAHGVRRWFARTPRAELTEALGEARIPSFGPNVMRVLKQLRDEDTSLVEVARIAEGDPGLSIDILRTVNSPAYGLLRRIDNVRHAVSLLGRSELETLTLTLAVRDAIPKNSFADRRFWQLAARRAAIARRLANHFDPSSASLSFSAGLLQDLAVPLLAEARPSYVELIADTNGAAQVEAEKGAYGFDHSEVAGWLCECWGFPTPLHNAISGHHGGDGAPPAVRLVAMIDKANLDAPESLIDEAHARFGIPTDVVQTALDAGREDGDELASAMTHPR